MNIRKLAAAMDSLLSKIAEEEDNAIFQYMKALVRHLVEDGVLINPSMQGVGANNAFPRVIRDKAILSCIFELGRTEKRLYPNAPEGDYGVSISRKPLGPMHFQVSGPNGEIILDEKIDYKTSSGGSRIKNLFQRIPETIRFFLQDF